MIQKTTLIAVALFSLIAFAEGRSRRTKRQIPTPHEIQIQTIGNTIKLDWSFQGTRSDVTFVVKYRKQGDRQWNQVQTRARTLLLSHLEHGRSYEIQIMAQSSAGQSMPSTIIQVPISAPPRVETLQKQETGTIPTPRSLEASLNGRDTVHLRWDPVKCGRDYCPYEVTVKQHGSGSGQIFKYTTNHAVIGKMAPGQTFTYEVRAAQPGTNKVSYPRTARVTIPHATSTIVIAENIQVQPVQGDPKSIKLIWGVPSNYRGMINGYTVYYATDKDSQEWKQQRVSGSNPEVLLRNLEPSQTYFVRIVTEFRGSEPKTTSQTYRFITPEAPLIENIKLIYNSDQTMRLEWIFHGYVNMGNIEGAQVLWTNDRNLPESRWQVLEARRGENGMSLPAKLEGNKQYFFKIYPRVRGRGLVNSNTVFEIMTRPHAPRQQTNTPDNVYDLRFVPRSRNIVLQWSIPNDRVNDLSGINILWTYDKNLPQNRWTSIPVSRQARRAIIEGLDTRRTIYFSIQPQVARGGSLPARYYRITPSQSQVTSASGSSPRVPETVSFETSFPGRPQTSTQTGSGSHTARHTSQQKCLRGCTISHNGSRKTVTGCSGDQICVEHCSDNRRGCNTGWCMDRSLVTAAKQST